MTGKRVILSARCGSDIRQVTAWYRQQGGAELARRWVAAVESALRHIGTYPQSGASRYGIELKMDDLRCWPVHGFPYLIFYVERGQRIEAGRVLHAQRDIPTWMGHDI